jgi:hypothetical protein
MADLWTIKYRALKMSAGEVFEVQALEPSKALTDFLGSYREDVAEIRQPDVSLILTNGCILKFTKTIHKGLLRKEVERVRFHSPNYAFDLSAPQSDAVKRIQELTGWNLKQTRAFVSKVYRDNDRRHRREKKMLDAARKKEAKVKGSLTRSGRGTAS